MFSININIRRSQTLIWKHAVFPTKTDFCGTKCQVIRKINPYFTEYNFQYTNYSMVISYKIPPNNWPSPQTIVTRPFDFLWYLLSSLSYLYPVQRHYVCTCHNYVQNSLKMLQHKSSFYMMRDIGR